MGGGSARIGSGGGGSYRSQISLHAAWNIQKQHQNEWFLALVDLKIAENAIFYTQKCLKRYSPKMFLADYMNLKIFFYLR